MQLRVYETISVPYLKSAPHNAAGSNSDWHNAQWAFPVGFALQQPHTLVGLQSHFCPRDVDWLARHDFLKFVLMRRNPQKWNQTLNLEPKTWMNQEALFSWMKDTRQIRLNVREAFKTCTIMDACFGTFFGKVYFAFWRTSEPQNSRSISRLDWKEWRAWCIDCIGLPTCIPLQEACGRLGANLPACTWSIESKLVDEFMLHNMCLQVVIVMKIQFTAAEPSSRRLISWWFKVTSQRPSCTGQINPTSHSLSMNNLIVIVVLMISKSSMGNHWISSSNSAMMSRIVAGSVSFGFLDFSSCTCSKKLTF